jgi:predicted nucleotidyltransferase component of viral defense system
MGKEILTTQQNKFIEFFKNEQALNKYFYLTGGTALAAFYLNHRKSEDLDFFKRRDHNAF